MVGIDTFDPHVLMLTEEGPIVRVGPGIYSICDPEAAATIYNTHNVFPKSKWYFTFQQPDEPNIFSTHNNAYAAEMRRKYKPAYDAFYTYEYAVDDCTQILEQKFSVFAAENQAVDLGWWLTCYAFDVNGEITVCMALRSCDASLNCYSSQSASVSSTTERTPAVLPQPWQKGSTMFHMLEYTLPCTRYSGS